MKQENIGPTREVILNLWYVADEDGFIYSLRVKPYVMEGSDHQKLAFLQDRAKLDYLIAPPFEIPERFHIQMSGNRKMPVAHIGTLALTNAILLFEDALKELENQFPAQSDISIPRKPVICVTPLVQNEEGVIVPTFSGQIKY